MFTKKDEKKEKRKVSDGTLWIEMAKIYKCDSSALIRKNTNTKYRPT